MERLKQRLDIASKALETLHDVVGHDDVSALVRDAAIQRFQYSFEATWKAMQRYLQVQEGIQPGSPKSVIRAAHQTGLLNDEQGRSALRMVDDRNLTVHTYNEALASQIYTRLQGYYALMNAAVSNMQSAIKAAP
ncbi:MAG: nucleotidyltransferase substrate binding protein [Nitrosospira sp.]|nr:nucleotidyltransferase substrate binding protein [Nitrosospira sp.]